MNRAILKLETAGVYAIDARHNTLIDAVQQSPSSDTVGVTNSVTKRTEFHKPRRFITIPKTVRYLPYLYLFYF
jgi:hypothetical protein